MIRYCEGSILDDDAEALVNPVNCVGVMGAGLAKQFKERFPENFRRYKAACDFYEVQVGRMFVTPVPYKGSPVWIINFPTKGHWREKSRMEWISDGIHDLRWRILELHIKSIAIPALGCGLGGLRWADVDAVIGWTLSPLRDVDVRVYPPR